MQDVIVLRQKLVRDLKKPSIPRDVRQLGVEAIALLDMVRRSRTDS
ncbi:hypothetical protein [Pseudonocardia alaniniphila]|uniref:Uncharacterized protein n=1 Tax=Pseudonocardia alaniniphila TaxID=75291 RepID=A0ABS9TA72_9PSEU|nr:hypothetical protein [Pseudonocardia alaniniphila]MCH6165313.1 hypothetical protein [Pseudonocardia alaniniphila]